MSTFSSAGRERKEQMKKLDDLMSRCCSLERKHQIAKDALVEAQNIWKESSSREAENNEKTEGNEQNLREVGIDASSTGSVVVRPLFQMKQPSLSLIFWTLSIILLFQSKIFWKLILCPSPGNWKN
jgi:hypothetical protein